MLGGKGNWLSQPEAVGLKDAVFLLFTLTFIGQKNHRFSCRTDQVGQLRIIRLYTVAGIKHKYNGISLVNRFLGL